MRNAASGVAGSSSSGSALPPCAFLFVSFLPAQALPAGQKSTQCDCGIPTRIGEMIPNTLGFINSLFCCHDMLTPWRRRTVDKFIWDSIHDS